MHADGPGVDAIHKPAACSWARNVELSELSVEQASIAESESLVPSPDLEPTVWRNDRLGRFPCQLRRRVYDDAAVKMQPVVKRHPELRLYVRDAVFVASVMMCSE